MKHIAVGIIGLLMLSGAQLANAASITKTQGTSLLSLQTLGSGAVVLGSSTDVSTKLAATVFIHVGRTATTALTNGVICAVTGQAAQISGSIQVVAAP